MQIWMNQWVRILPKFTAYFEHNGIYSCLKLLLMETLFKVVLWVLKTIIHILNHTECQTQIACRKLLQFPLVWQVSHKK